MNDKALSGSINKMNILLTIFIIFLHSNMTHYSINEMQTLFFQHVQPLFDMACPGFFMISGFLMYRNMSNLKAQYPEKIRKRFRSLVIPYFFYSAAWMAAYTVCRFLPVIGSFVPDSMTDYTVTENIRIFLMAEFDGPIWYLRVLFVLQVLSPVFYWILKKHKYIGPVFYAAAVGINAAFGTGYRTVPFWIPMFSFGIWLALYWSEINTWLEKYLKTKGYLISGALFLTGMWIAGSMGNTTCAVYYVFRNFGSIAFTLTVLPFIENMKLPNISKWTFFIYVMHYPILIMILRVLLKLLPAANWSYAIIYVLTIVGSIASVVGLGILIEKICAPLWKFMSGGRG